MILLITLILTILYAYFMANHIKKHRMLHYGIAVAITAGQFILWLLPETDFAKSSFVTAFNAGIVGSCILFIVMFTGTMMPRDPISKRFYSIRKDLSIIGCYLVIYHIIHYLITMTLHLTKLPVLALILYITGLIASIIMVPLFITSFIKYRKKVAPKAWKKLQKWAYPFIILVFIHAIVANINSAGMDHFKVSLYATLMILYCVLRLRKEKLKKQT